MTNEESESQEVTESRQHFIRLYARINVLETLLAEVMAEGPMTGRKRWKQEITKVRNFSSPALDSDPEAPYWAEAEKDAFIAIYERAARKTYPLRYRDDYERARLLRVLRGKV